MKKNKQDDASLFTQRVVKAVSLLFRAQLWRTIKTENK